MGHGDGLSQEYTLAGLHSLAPQLLGAWRWLSTRRRNELPRRAPLMLPENVRCIAGLAGAQERIDVALGLSLCFPLHVAKRGNPKSEKSDLSFGGGQVRQHLGFTKGHRKGALQLAVVTDKVLSLFLEKHCEGK